MPLLFVVVTFKEAVSVALLTEILLDSLAALTDRLMVPLVTSTTSVPTVTVLHLVIRLQTIKAFARSK